MNAFEDSLHCPRCNSDFLHHDRMTTHTRIEDGVAEVTRPSSGQSTRLGRYRVGFALCVPPLKSGQHGFSVLASVSSNGVQWSSIQTRYRRCPAAR